VKEGVASPRSKQRGEMGRVQQARCGGEGWGSGAGTTRARRRQVAVDMTPSLELDIGEVCGEANGWA
jgi:hypothetical protein